jgi:hypothetical protein
MAEGYEESHLRAAIAMVSPKSAEKCSKTTEVMECVSMLIFVPVFLCGWWYAISQFGWFLGLGLGWLPAAGFAWVITTLWSWLFMLLLLIGGYFFGASKAD